MSNGKETTLGVPIDGSVIQTRSGVYVDPLEPWSFIPDIDDIAWALSRQTRFSGHTTCAGTYTVAQHSVLVAETAPRTHRLSGLLHDASEAYLVDLPSPIKHSPLGVGYRLAERRLQRRINIAFGLHPTIPPAVKHADLVLLATERRDLMPQTGEPWAVLEGVVPLEGRIDVCGPEDARRLFLDVFEGCAIAEAA